ncbi:uncharacterized protein N7446_005107 [Penicillium canescens]|uniref:Uncharacterized protein n=1 Tax=Penicillium canescens TaxID=5083 RepID=A0AAD6I963_PENCN|nr:uncharacterized protein N7446_005107 [Penicillium canescens]KAJ6038295.1 hypothetical protein N7460_008066 [Penicillium canescens]KAJ6068070.1 hypothetical protein N7446_005107 [Penicillium canescens]
MKPGGDLTTAFLLPLPPSSLDLAFEDDTLDLVKQAWKKIMGDEVEDDDFMIFEIAMALPTNDA